MVERTSTRKARAGGTQTRQPGTDPALTREIKGVSQQVQDLAGLVDELADQVYELRSAAPDEPEPDPGPDTSSRPDPQDEAGLYGSRLGANMLRTAVSEFIGTFLLVLAGTSVAVAASLGSGIAGAGLDSLAVALAFGLVLVALVNALGHISGCHLNPAVTIGLAATKRFPWAFVPAYLLSQVLGAIAAALTVWACFGDRARDMANLGAPGTQASFASAFLVEAVITFLLVLVVISVATDGRVEAAGAGVAVGFALAAAVLIGGPVTGGSVNPARALGPMIVSGEFSQVLVYLLAPLAGGVAAAVLYGTFLAKAEAPSPD